MFLLDRLLVGSIEFVLDKVLTAAESEMNDDSVLREQLLEAQMQLELGEIDEASFVEIERDLLARIREIRGATQGGLVVHGSDVRVTGVDASVVGDRHEAE